MIIECESCHTRFRLDEARISASGAKVRCSRCKTAFVVQRPGATRDEIVDEVVAEVTGSDAARAPSATEDLFDATASGSSPFGGPGASLGNDDDTPSEKDTPSDEKWEFDEAPGIGATAAASKPSRPRPRASAKPSAKQESDEPDEELDALGSPEGWDLVGGAARKLAAEARFEEPAPTPPPAAKPPSRIPAASPRAERSVERALAAAAEATSTSPARAQQGWAAALRAAAQHAIDSGVWVASVALCAVGVALAFSPRPDTRAAERSALPAVFGAQSLEVTVHRVESGIGGMLTVVRGQLPESAATREPLRLRVSWVDAEGTPIAGGSAIAGPPLARQKLRELSAERLRREAEAHALELSAAGPFEAVFAELPPGAKGISLMREREPAPPLPATHSQEAETEPATASSRPTARPSSE